MHKFRLYKRPKGKQKNWLITWTDAQGKTKEFSTGTEDELIATNIFNAFKFGHTPTNEISCGYILNEYSVYLRKRQSPDNQKKTKSTTKVLMYFFEDQNPYDLESKIMEYENVRFRNGISISTINRDLSHLKASLNWASSKKSITEKHGKILDKPPYHIEIEKVKNSRTRWLKTHEEKKFLKVVEKYPDYIKLTIGLALTTAQRLGAILSLKKGAVDFDSQLIDFNYGIKNDGIKRKGRSICKIDKFISKLLKEAVLKSQSGHIIEKNGKPIVNIFNEFKAIREEADIDDFVFHDLRTTWASNALQDGVPMIEISYQLAHSSVKITEEHYARLPKATREKATEHTEKRFKGKSL